MAPIRILHYFFDLAALNLSHRAFVAAIMAARPSFESLRFFLEAGAGVVLAAIIAFLPAHLAFCDAAIFALLAALTIRFLGAVVETGAGAEAAAAAGPDWPNALAMTFNRASKTDCSFWSASRRAINLLMSVFMGGTIRGCTFTFKQSFESSREFNAAYDIPASGCHPVSEDLDPQPGLAALIVSLCASKPV